MNKIRIISRDHRNSVVEIVEADAGDLRNNVLNPHAAYFLARTINKVVTGEHASVTVTSEPVGNPN